MQVILLEKIRNLGSLGERVKVKSGYGRNYLIPYSKAVPATVDNIAKFEAQRADLEKIANEKLQAAQKRADKLADLVVTIAARAADEGKLYGSLGVREIADAISKAVGIEIEKSEVHMPEGPIRQIGEYEYMIEFHTDVEANVKVVVVAE